LNINWKCKNESSIKSYVNINFGGSVTTAPVHCIGVHGVNVCMVPGIFYSALATDKKSASRSS
jgi:hypothetical protein